MMITKNEILLIFRHLWHNKIYTIVNICGLAIGLATCFMIFLYVDYQLSYDSYNDNLKNTYLIYSERTGVKISENETPLILGSTLKEQYPEINEFARWKKVEGQFEIGDNHFTEDLVFSDSKLFNILTLPIVSGSLKEFGAEINTIIISEKASKKYFGDSNPVNKNLSLTYKNHVFILRVVAVMKDIPKASTFVTDFLVPLRIFENLWNQFRVTLPAANEFSDWTFNNINTYILLSPNTNTDLLKEKLYKFSFQPEHLKGTAEVSIFRLMPVKDIFFNSSMFYNNSFPAGNKTNTYIYATIATLCLLISLITFLMMNSARAILNTKEVCVRKVLGANVEDLLKQNLIESLSITFLALPISILLVELFLPIVSQYIGRSISSDYFHNWKIIFIFWSVSLIIGIIAGGFVSYYYAKINPLDVLRNKILVGSNKKTFRRILVVTQLSISSALIFSSFVVYKQLNYFLNKDFGFKKEGLLFLYSDSKDTGRHFDDFKFKLMKNPDIINVTGGMSLPGTNTISTISWITNKKNHNQNVNAEYFFVKDEDFIETMGMEMKYGESFKKMGANDSAQICIINETAMNELSLDNPIGEKIDGLKVIGVVKDFNSHTLHSKIKATVIKRNSAELGEIAVRIHDHASIKNTIDYIRKVSSKYNNDTPMRYQFLEDRLGELYQEEYNFFKVIGFFTITTIIVICMGLFGMSSFVLNQHKKEIGIRKVMGASLINILLTLGKDFIILSIISSVISFFTTYYFLNKWLNNFYYRENIGIMSFIMSCVILLAIVIITISYNSIKLAQTHATEVLRND